MKKETQEWIRKTITELIKETSLPMVENLARLFGDDGPLKYLIPYRHPECVKRDGNFKDDSRKLSDKGKKQADSFCEWLLQQVRKGLLAPLFPVVVASKVERCTFASEKIESVWNDKYPDKNHVRHKKCSKLYTEMEEKKYKELIYNTDKKYSDPAQQSSLSTFMNFRLRKETLDPGKRFDHFKPFVSDVCASLMETLRGEVPSDMSPSTLVMVGHRIYLQLILYFICVKMEFDDEEVKKLWYEPLHEGHWILIDFKTKCIEFHLPSTIVRHDSDNWSLSECTEGSISATFDNNSIVSVF